MDLEEAIPPDDRRRHSSLDYASPIEYEGRNAA
jgi:hypothetical protein